MSFPRKSDGSLSLFDFQALSTEEKKIAMLSIKDNPEEVKILRDFLSERQQQTAITITTLESEKMALESENKALLFAREQHKTKFIESTMEALDQIQPTNPSRVKAARSGCTIL